MKQVIIDAILKEKLIAIVRNVKSERLLPTAQAMYEGGIRLLEVAFDTSGNVSDEITAKNIHMLSRHFCGKMFIGAGTVTDEKKLELANSAGAEFIISPDTNADIIHKTNSLGMVSIPGAVTPTEINAAATAGADFVKVFPAGNFGGGYIKSIQAPLRNIRLLAVGGIDMQNIREYLASGVCGFGIGSNIADLSLINSGDYEAITKLAEGFVSAVKEV